MEFSDIKAADKQYFMGVFGDRLPAAFDHAEDVYLFDTDGKKYTDFLAGIAVNSLGYSDEGFKNTLKRQINKLIHSSNYYYIEPQAELAKALCEKTGMDKVFFGNSGAEANECAIKLAKKYAYEKDPASANFVSIKNSFHGRTLATLSATGQPKFHEPFRPGTFSYTYIDANDAEAAKAAINAKTCGVLVEIIQGEGGVLPLDPGYVKLLRELCDANDALLIVDEVQTGMGRTGKFLALEHCGIKADVVTLAKALGNGIPIGACLASEKAAAAFKPGDHGSTFGGNHLACAAALYVTNAIDGPMLEQINTSGTYFKDQLDKFMNNHPDSVCDVRGKGLLLAAELTKKHSAADIKKKLFEKGFLIGTAGANSLRFAPPYVIKPADIDSLMAALENLIQ